MRIARLDTPVGPRHAVWTGEAWEVVEDCFADPPLGTGATIAPDDAHLLAPCEPRVLVGIAHNKTNNDHVLPIQAWHKSVRSVVSAGEVIQARRDVGTVNVEGELAVVIGRDTEGITVDSAFDYVLSGTFNLPSTVAESIAYVARWVPLGPGDVIMSGSPNTFVAVTPGDEVEIRLSGVGALTNRVV